jgi:hypothetical protein
MSQGAGAIRRAAWEAVTIAPENSSTDRLFPNQAWHKSWSSLLAKIRVNRGSEERDFRWPKGAPLRQGERGGPLGWPA